jgi:hypothetical protein
VDIYESFLNEQRQSMAGQVTLDPNSWFDGARVFIPGYTETLEDSIYDYQALPAAALTGTRRFFSEGQGGPNNRTLSDTNLMLNAQLPAGEAFLVIGLGIEYYPDVPPVGTSQNDFINDMWAFYTSGNAQFKINQVPYAKNANLLQFFPENQFTSNAQFAVNQATPADAVLSQQSTQITGRLFKIVPKLIESSTQFSGEISEVAARENAGRVGFRLYGYRARNAQG